MSVYNHKKNNDKSNRSSCFFYHCYFYFHHSDDKQQNKNKRTTNNDVDGWCNGYIDIIIFFFGLDDSKIYSTFSLVVVFFFLVLFFLFLPFRCGRKESKRERIKKESFITILMFRGQIILVSWNGNWWHI